MGVDRRRKCAERKKRKQKEKGKRRKKEKKRGRGRKERTYPKSETEMGIKRAG